MALTDSLISYWKLDEASGSRADSHGADTLAETGSVGSGTGIISSAASFGNNSANYLGHASNTDLQTGDVDFTWAGWVKFTDLSSTHVVLTKDNGGVADNPEYALYGNSSGQLTFRRGMVRHPLGGDVVSRRRLARQH
jgi:hypothetical protein